MIQRFLSLCKNKQNAIGEATRKIKLFEKMVRKSNLQTNDERKKRNAHKKTASQNIEISALSAMVANTENWFETHAAMSIRNEVDILTSAQKRHTLS